MVGAVRFVAGNGSAGIGLCPLGRVHLDIDKFPVFYKPGSAFDVILVGLIPMELNGYCWWTVKRKRHKKDGFHYENCTDFLAC